MLSIDSNTKPTLARKITLLVLIGLIIIFITISALSILIIKDKLNEDFEFKVNYLINNLTNSLAKPIWDLDNIQINEILDGYGKYKFIDHIRLIDEDGKNIIAEIGEHPSDEPDKNYILFPNYRTFVKEITFNYKGEEKIIAKLDLDVNFSQQVNFLENFLLTIFTIASLFFLLLIIYIYRVIKITLIPITSLSNKIAFIGQGEKVVLPSINSDSYEIESLYNALKIYKETNEKYAENLEVEVAKRTYELEEYKNGLEQLIEEQTEHIVKSRDEAIKANNAKSEFLANMSHELRTPMHAIISYSQMGIDKAENIEPSKLLKYFNNINTSANRLLNLVNSLLDLSKLESGKVNLYLDKILISEIADEVLNELESLIKSKAIKIKTNYSEIPKIFLDREKIFRVIMNIISNAVKYSSNGTEIEINIYSNAENLFFSVIDNGQGIPENELEYIFDKFAQSSNTKTGAGGTGLGLAICSEIIKLHNGKIWAENRSDTKGAIFTFTLPVNNEEYMV
ncbi:MAG: HAMP domain-containing sensor histidine kinase [Rickettsiales bacterium]|nr:HAMP domain-containing sensor histidine kinase [Rickettsiales bacterium]